MSRLGELCFTYEVSSDYKVAVEFRANQRNKLPAISIPDLTDKVTMECFYDDESRVEYNDVDQITQNLQEWVKNGDISLDMGRYSLPSVKYYDITEANLLGGQEISQENLESKVSGLWAYSGIRMLCVEFSDIDCFGSEKYIRINFKRINDTISNERNFTTPKFPFDDNKAFILLDTNNLGGAFAGEHYDNKYLRFSGDIEVICTHKAGKEVAFKYPIHITVINTNLSVCDKASKQTASIDFGTSSTCVAIKVDGRSEPELLTISSSDDSADNVYENPTNLMLYNWKTLYDQWKNENECPPLFFKGDKRDIARNKRVEYNFGYEVKDLLGEADKAEIDAILTLIKMVPYQIIHEKRQIDLNPFCERESYIRMVTEPEKQDKNHLDPVAFYGYLIGRAINDVSKHSQIYTKFQVTCPVKFNEETKKKTAHSLEYGLKRSVPKPLRDSVRVEMKFVEPVAYIGALCGTDYFQIDEGENKKFAVYDFGGGTLDYSYGIVTNADDELIVDILGVGGNESIGGEKLIERISFKIYVSNLGQMVDNNIPIAMPRGEKQPDELPDKLISPSNYTRANMHKINEVLSRHIFEGREIEGETMCELFDIDGEPVSLKLAYSAYDIDEDLEEIISDTIQVFYNEMQAAFKGIEDFSVNDVYIFKAGNSSKNHFVTEIMEKVFEGNTHIQMVDQIADKTEEFKRYAITPKTAVAFGQLKLNDFTINMNELMFNYYVGYISHGTGKFKSCINKNENNKEWRKFRKITNDAVDLYYAEFMPNGIDEAKSISIDTNGCSGKVMYIRILDEVNIEYCICDAGVEPIDGDVEVRTVKLM